MKPHALRVLLLASTSTLAGGSSGGAGDGDDSGPGNVPFQIGDARRVLTYPGTGTLEHGIDNTQLSICR